MAAYHTLPADRPTPALGGRPPSRRARRGNVPRRGDDEAAAVDACCRIGTASRPPERLAHPSALTARLASGAGVRSAACRQKRAESRAQVRRRVALPDGIAVVWQRRSSQEPMRNGGARAVGSAPARGRHRHGRHRAPSAPLPLSLPLSHRRLALRIVPKTAKVAKFRGESTRCSRPRRPGTPDPLPDTAAASARPAIPFRPRLFPRDSPLELAVMPVAKCPSAPRSASEWRARKN
jgi:hypothetical protein